MSASNEQGANTKRIWPSILIGLGSAVVGFLAGAILSGLLIFVFFSIFGTFTEVGPMLVVYVSSVIGMISAVILGVRSRINTYKLVPESNQQ